MHTNAHVHVCAHTSDIHTHTLHKDQSEISFVERWQSELVLMGFVIVDDRRLGRGISKVPHSPRAGSSSSSPCLAKHWAHLQQKTTTRPLPLSASLYSAQKGCLLFSFPFQNTTETVEQENFALKVPRGMRNFCVKVLPYVKTRNNKAEWSEEQCLHITLEQCEWPRLRVFKLSWKIQKATLRVDGACPGPRASA